MDDIIVLLIAMIFLPCFVIVCLFGLPMAKAYASDLEDASVIRNATAKKAAVALLGNAEELQDKVEG